MRYSKSKMIEHRVIVSKMVAVEPNISIRSVAAALEAMELPLHLDNHYIGKILNKIAKERTYRYLIEGKEETLAKFEDFVEYVIRQLRVITSKADIEDRDKIAALNSMVKNYEKVMNIKFDMGIFERQLGRMSADVRTLDLLKALKEMRAAELKGEGKK